MRLGAEHDSLSSTGDVTFDFLPRKTGNEAAHVVFLLFQRELLSTLNLKPLFNTEMSPISLVDSLL